MSEMKKMKTALVSVFHKDGLDELLAELHKNGVKFLSTGGTQKFIAELGYPCAFWAAARLRATSRRWPSMKSQR